MSREYDLVAIGDIARMARVTVDAVHQWTRRPVGFPRPVAITSAGKIWLRADIQVWLIRTGRCSSQEADRTPTP